MKHILQHYTEILRDVGALSELEAARVHEALEEATKRERQQQDRWWKTERERLATRPWWKRQLDPRGNVFWS